MSHNIRPSRYAVSQSKARIFVGQLEPYVTEQDLFPVFSCYGKILHLNIVRHSTTVTPNEERRIPTAFVWYETTAEADAAIAALHNIFTFSAPDEEESKIRYIQVSYADKSPECTAWGRWQKKQAEMLRRSAPANGGSLTSPTSGNGSGGFPLAMQQHSSSMRPSYSTNALSSLRQGRHLQQRGGRQPPPSNPPNPMYSSYESLYDLGKPQRGMSHSRSMPAAMWKVSAVQRDQRSRAFDHHAAISRFPRNREREDDMIMPQPTFTVTSGS